MRTRHIIPVAVLIALAAPVQAGCDANNTYSFAFQSQVTGTLNYAGTYTYSATNPLGATQTIGTSFTANGLSSSIVNDGTNNFQLPRIGNAVVSTLSGAKVLTLGGTFSARTASITSNTRTISVTFTFATPIRDFGMTVHDIDYNADQFRDWIHIRGSNGTNGYVPALTTPHGNNNSGTPVATNSSIRFGPLATPAISTSEAVGVSASANNNSNTGDINVSFAEPVTSVTLRYGNFPLQSGETQTGQQFMGISELHFCPMPKLTVAKTSAPYATSGDNRFAIPGADMAYSLTVTNSGGSPVDLGGLVLTDPLPANVTFYNGDYDAASVGMGPVALVAGSSGVTLPATGIKFSMDGVTYSATAPAGYTTAVRYLQLTPTGSLAANSSATFRFRASIK